MPIKVRFAPSPTGFVHIGSLRTALYNYLYAKKEKGVFLLRIEDTDRTRLVEGAVENLLNSLKWANIEPDEGVIVNEDGKIIKKGDAPSYIQSERLPIYKEYINYLLEKGYAYPCFCTKERLDTLREEQKAKGQDTMYDGLCKHLSKEEIQKRIDAGEPYVIRLNVPENVDISFEDKVRGTVVINSNTVDDQVLMKSDGFPTYHFAVVVDDHLMGITHIIRGEEWLTSTPKHVLLYDMFGWEKPVFVHLPNILNKDKKKLSKRQGDVAVEDFKAKGYLPEALINYIALLGWSPGNEQEIFSIDDLIEAFSLDKISKSGAVFDVEKLNWVNQQYIKTYDDEKLLSLLEPFIFESGLFTQEELKAKHDYLILATKTLRERISYLKQFPEELKNLMTGEISEVEQEAIDFMKLEHMKLLFDIVEKEVQKADKIDNDFVDNLISILKENKIKGKNLFMGMRVLVTGQTHGPDLHNSIELIGKDNLLNRLNQTKKYVF
ncbi:glutamate--tRNA ligase [Criibacterium bergeronii]|uniref:Glutamate--tRNA ligase n=1 Tax=Criibacterium bergeronii TaxID=1871336 RepID=A0A552VDI3_9FIRM|nr:glutamate--tRNA ligase [Criibacterium bergeronii]TRW28522.1 glutamate--tRNA ligase [Criibacterium bergeronii]